MAVGGRMRHRAHRMHRGAKMAVAGGLDLKPRGRIRGRDVKPACADSEVKPKSADSAEDAWIYVRGCRIERAGLRFNSQGDVYVPDSEDDESTAEVAADKATVVERGPAVAADGVAGMDLALAVADDGLNAVLLHW